MAGFVVGVDLRYVAQALLHGGITVSLMTYCFKLEQVLHVHHSFAVVGWQQRVILAIND